MDPAKVDTIVHWPALRNLKDIQSFLGFANFFRRFIYGFSRLAAPLTALTRKDVKFVWDEKCEHAFQGLKKAFTSQPILLHFDPDRKTVIETNASDYVSGGILSQYDDDGILHPVAYFSKKHSPAECNYEIYDKELMAIVRAFEEWRPELEGSTSPIDVISDHKNLEYFASSKQLSRRQARWSEFLSRFDFKIVYRPGKAGGKPDALTRRSGDLPKVGDTSNERNNYQYQVILKPHNFATSSSQHPSGSSSSSSYHQDITLHAIQLHLEPRLTNQYLAATFLDGEEALDNDDSNEMDISFEPQLDLTTDQAQPDDDPLDVPTETLWYLARERDRFAPLILKLLKEGARYHKGIPLAEYEDRNGYLYSRDRCYVPRSNRLRLRIIQQAHDSVPGGHPGRTKTYDLVTRSYWWSGMYDSIVRFVRNCHVCRRSKPSRQKYQGWLRPLPPPEQRWRDVSLDYVRPLPPSTYNGVTY